MKSSSLYMAMRQGISSPREYRDKLIHDWELHLETSRHLRHFFKRKCSSKFLFDNLHNGEIHVGGTTYSVIWVSKPNYIKRIGEVILSFRYCEMLLAGYVMVKAWEESDGRNIEELFIKKPSMETN